MNLGHSTRLPLINTVDLLPGASHVRPFFLFPPTQQTPVRQPSKDPSPRSRRQQLYLCKLMPSRLHGSLGRDHTARKQKRSTYLVLGVPSGSPPSPAPWAWLAQKNDADESLTVPFVTEQHLGKPNEKSASGRRVRPPAFSLGCCFGSSREPCVYPDPVHVSAAVCPEALPPARTVCGQQSRLAG